MISMFVALIAEEDEKSSPMLQRKKNSSSLIRSDRPLRTDYSGSPGGWNSNWMAESRPASIKSSLLLSFYDQVG